MTHIVDVEIRNFRGIHALRWGPNPGINCLIGPGDGGKSTVLDAIDLTLGSRQSYTFTDADFHRCNVSEPISIDVTLGGLDDDLRNLEAYGHFLRGLDPATHTFHNETSANLETVLTVRLIVRDDLEPQWLLYSPGPAADGRERNLQWKHRQKLAPVRLGVVASHHMSLGPRSVLGKLSTDSTQASAALASASRQARQSFADQGCDGVDDILTASKQIADQMGIRVDEIKALLDIKGVTLSGGSIALHDDDHVPMKSLGSGSMRLLVAGLQKAVGQSSIFLIDEIEFGLEPYRIVRLLDSLGAKSNDQTQQVFLTTHSPLVLRELSSIQLHALRTTRSVIPANGLTDADLTPAQKVTHNAVIPLGSSEAAQKTLRACAEAFLAPSVIVCEGKTEIGVLRGIDLYNQDCGVRSLLSHGCHWADGTGSSLLERARVFATMGYRTALFMDSDVAYPAQEYSDLAAQGISVYRWPDGYSTEAALFASAPAAMIGPLLNIAIDWKSADSVNSRIQNLSGDIYTLELCRSGFVDAMRPILGQAAGDGKWFKDITPAERVLREVVMPGWNGIGPVFSTPLLHLWEWIRSAPTFQAPPPVGDQKVDG